MKKISIIMCALLVLSVAACTQSPAPSPSVDTSSSPLPSVDPSPAESTDVPEPTNASPAFEGSRVNVGIIRGPSGMGAAYLMDSSNSYVNDYNCELAAAPTEITAMLANGELDIAALPSNTAAALYNKLDGGVTALTLTTRGVLYILENGDSIKTVEDLRGKTIYAFGQGANPEYVLNYLLRENGMEPGTDVFIEFRENDEITALASTGEIEVCMLPVPAATTVLMKNGDFRSALDLTNEWNKVGDSELIMTCVVARTDFLIENPQAVDLFLEEYYDSLYRVTQLEAGVYQLMADLTIVGNATVAELAIPDSNLCFITGEDMKSAIEGYYDVLFEADPTAIGGAVPGGDFYYTGYAGTFSFIDGK